jgi:hypothetical protein
MQFDICSICLLLYECQPWCQQSEIEHHDFAVLYRLLKHINKVAQLMVGA